MTAQNRGLTGEQISALEMLAGCPDGCTEAVSISMPPDLTMMVEEALALIKRPPPRSAK